MVSATQPVAVLNVGGDAESRQALTELLSRAGYQVMEAATAEEALRADVGAPPGLVILDTTFPLTDPPETSRRLKAGWPEATVPVLHLVSAEQAGAAAAAPGGSEEDAYLPHAAGPVAILTVAGALLRAGEVRAAREASRYWEDTFDALADAMCVIDLEGRVRRCNRALATLVGKPVEQITGASCELVLGDLYRAYVLPLLTVAQQTRRRQTAATEVEGRWYRVTLDPVPREGEALSGAVIAVCDITGQRESERELRRLLEMEGERAREAQVLETILEAAPAWFGYMDAEMNFVRVNTGFAQSLRRARHEVVGRNARDLFGHVPAIVEYYREALRTGQAIEQREVPSLLAPPEGAASWPELVDALLVPIRDETGHVSGLVISVTDVTDRVREREQQVERERSGRRLAETLAVDVAHRVKNNLVMIAGLLQMQINSEADDRTAAILHDAVVRLLNFAEIHAQLSLFGLGDVDLLEATRRIAEITRRVFSAAQVEMVVEGEPLSYPSAAVTTVSIALNELLTNAIKHGAPSEDGRRHVRVELGRDRETFRLAVWNAGPPVSPDFEARSRRGLGLRLVRDLAAHHAGTLTLRSSEGGTLAEVLVDDASLRRST